MMWGSFVRVDDGICDHDRVRSLLPPNEEWVGEQCEVYCGDG